MKLKLIHNRTFFLTTNKEILTSKIKIKIKDTDNQIINILFIGFTTKNEIILRNN
jgi:hypothetical protein